MDNAIVWHLASISQPRIARRVQAQQVESDYVGRAAARVASRVTKFVAYFGAQQLRAGINMHRKKHSRGSSSKNGKQTVGRAKTKPKTVTKIQTHAKTRMRHDRAVQRVRECERERGRDPCCLSLFFSVVGSPLWHSPFQVCCVYCV